MKEKITYIAYDETEWETKEACQEHEAVFDVFIKVLKHTVLIDMEGQVFPIVFDVPVDVLWQDLDGLLDIIYGIKIQGVSDMEVAQTRELIYNQLGHTFPSCTGIFKWDDNTNDWISWKTALRDFTRAWQPIVNNVSQQIKNTLIE